MTGGESRPADRQAAQPGEDRAPTQPGEDRAPTQPGEDRAAIQPGESRAAAQPGEDRPGDPACLLRRVCPSCGAVADADPPTTCPQCHTRLP